MRTQPMKAAAAVAACCASASMTLAFQITPPPTMKTKLHGASLSPIDDDQVDDIIDITANDDLHGNVLFSEGPRALGPKRTFLGLRRESGIMRRMSMEQQSQQQSAGASTTTTTAHRSFTTQTTKVNLGTGLSPSRISGPPAWPRATTTSLMARAASPR